MNLKKFVGPFKIPFALSLSKGGRDFEKLILNNMLQSVDASASSVRTDCNMPQLRFLE